MFHYYCFNKDEFLSHYHKRSNVESTFSMIKAKFRDHVRSRTDAGMMNEVGSCPETGGLLLSATRPIGWSEGRSIVRPRR
jgi:hypothetical protein